MPIAHGFVGVSIIAYFYPKPFKARYYLPILTGAFLANLADFDFLLVFATHNKDWHRGFTHSIIFSFVVGLLFYIYFGQNEWRKSLAFGLAYASHFVLDFITTKIGGGMELFFPFTNERYGLRYFGLSEYPSKILKGNHGAVHIESPRDRLGTFEPEIIKKVKRGLPGWMSRFLFVCQRAVNQRHCRSVSGNIWTEFPPDWFLK